PYPLPPYSTFTPHDRPTREATINVQASQQAKSKLITHKMNWSRHQEEMRNALLIRLSIFRGGTKPNVRVPLLTPISRKHLSNVLRPLGQELPIQLVAFSN